MKLNIMLSEGLCGSSLCRQGVYVICVTEVDRVSPELTSPLLAPFAPPFCVCRRCHRHAKGNKAVLIAHHEKSTPRFNPILDVAYLLDRHQRDDCLLFNRLGASPLLLWLCLAFPQ